MMERRRCVPALMLLLWSICADADTETQLQLRGSGVDDSSKKSNNPEPKLDHDGDATGFQKLSPSGIRKDRFPSVEERVKLYMSNWYVPPCSDNTEGLARYQYDMSNKWPKVNVTDVSQKNVDQSTLSIQNIIEPDQLFLLDPDILADCARPRDQVTEDEENGIKYETEDRVKFRINMNMYCTDTVDLLQTREHVGLEYETDEERLLLQETPILMQFGDMKRSHVFGMINVPHIKKFRSGTTQANLDQVTSEECYHGARPMLTNNHNFLYFQPVIWKLATHRHYRALPEVFNLDTPWEKKMDKAIFRGQLTGAVDDGYDKKDSDYNNCMKMRRCKLVYDSATSEYIDAKLTNTRKRLPESIDGRQIQESKIPMERLMEFKAIIMIEGNDVASGLKWALLSQSVVLMSKPRFTSWAMEELLEPWVHYIPINDDASDVEEKLKWMFSHDDEARKISERASLWMEDLIFHPDAARDDTLIKEEILRRYRAHFIKAE